METKQQTAQTVEYSPKPISACKRIYIIGSVESGKAALARRLARRFGLPWYDLDNVIWERHPDGDVKRSEEQRDKIFRNIIISEKWIIEDVLRPCFIKGLRMADVIIFLDPPNRRTKLRAFLRILRQAMRFEKSKSRHTVTVFKSMRDWQGNTELNRKNFMKRLDPYLAKVVTLKSAKEIDLYF